MIVYTYYCYNIKLPSATFKRKNLVMAKSAACEHGGMNTGSSDNSDTDQTWLFFAKQNTAVVYIALVIIRNEMRNEIVGLKSK